MRGIGDEEFMHSAAAMTTTTQLTADGVRVDVAITNVGAGHSLPTGVPLRQILLLVRATDAAGQPLALVDGPRLPDWAVDYADQPGWAYIKILRDIYTGEAPTMSHWRPATIISDTRIAARATDQRSFTFATPAEGPVTVEARLLYRREFRQLMIWKGWDDADFVMAEDQLEIR
jgi:hypothetical protein